MNRSDIAKYLDPQLGRSKTTSQGLKYCCPKQGCDPSATKFNLEINLRPNAKFYLSFHCWACHYKGHLKQLLRNHSETDGWRSIPELAYSFNDIQKENIKPDAELPTTIPYHLSPDIVDYLKHDRHLDDSILQERKILYCYTEGDPLYEHLIFPFYEGGSLIGYSSQNINTKKYKNHRNLNFIPYKDLINPNYPIIITEGVYDSFSVPNAIPMLGTAPSEELYKFCKDKKVILALDSDVSLDDKKAIANKLYFYGAKSVLIFELKEYKDLNEYKCKDEENLRLEIKEAFEKLINVT